MLCNERLWAAYFSHDQPQTCATRYTGRKLFGPTVSLPKFMRIYMRIGKVTTFRNDRAKIYDGQQISASFFRQSF